MKQTFLILKILPRTTEKPQKIQWNKIISTAAKIQGVVLLI